MSAGTVSRGLPATVAATPYAWPFHGALDPSRLALVACCDSSWRPAQPERAAEADAADTRLAQLTAVLASAGGLVVAVCATPSRLTRAGSADRSRTAGAGPDGPAPVLVAAGTTAITVAATGVNAFHGSPLDDLLRDHRRTDLLLAGWGLEGPVHSTMRAANDRGYECLLVGDASIPTVPELAFPALEMVRFSGGIFGAHTDTDNVISLLRALGSERQDSTPESEVES